MLLPVTIFQQPTTQHALVASNTLSKNCTSMIEENEILMGGAFMFLAPAWDFGVWYRTSITLNLIRYTYEHGTLSVCMYVCNLFILHRYTCIHMS